MMRRRRAVFQELNLSALIDILSIMLFFLMTTVSFLTLKTLNASVPALSKGAVDTKDGVNVSVEILATGYVLKASGQPADVKHKRLKIEENIPRKADGSLDSKKLTSKLWDIKKIADEQKNIMIFPQDNTSFQDVVTTMDASRFKPSIVDPSKRVPMFTRPVLSELNK